MAWKKLGENTLTSAGDAITTDNLQINKFLHCLCHVVDSGLQRQDWRKNSDSNNNYAIRRSINGGAEETFANVSRDIIPTGGNTDDDSFMVTFGCNIANEEKLIIGFYTSQVSAGASTAPSRSENVGKYIPSPETDVDEINIVNLHSGDFDIDSNLSVLGDEGQQFGAGIYTDDFSTYAITKLPKFVDNFSGTDDWIDTGTGYGVNTTNDRIEATLQADGIDNRTDFDLGTENVSDERWVLRCKINISSLTAGNRTAILIGITDTNSGQATSQDSIIGCIDLFDSIPFGYGPEGRDNQSLPIQANSTEKIDATINTATDYYLELKRISETKCSFEIFTDSLFTTSLAGKSILSIPSTIRNLRYIKIYERELSGTGSLSFTVDDVEFFNKTEEGTKTFSDDFSGTSPDWQQTGTKVSVNTTNNEIDWDATRDGSDHILVHDLQTELGTTVSDENWTLRYKITFNNVVSPSSENLGIYVGLSDSNESVGFASSQDKVTSYFARSNTGFNRSRADASTGTYPAGLTDIGLSDDLWVEGNTIYVELKRNSITNFELSLYSDNNYRELIESVSSSGIDSTINSLRYLKILIRAGADVSGTFDGIIDDIEFYNGVSVPKTPIKEVKLFEDSFANYANQTEADTAWVPQDTPDNQVNITNDNVDFTVKRDGTNTAITHDLGTPVSDIGWTLRWTLTINSFVKTTGLSSTRFVGLSDTASSTGSGSTNDIIRYAVINTVLTGDGTQVSLSARDNASAVGSSDSAVGVFSVGETLYMELKRVSATRVEARTYSDPDYTQEETDKTLSLTIPSTITGLQYIRIDGPDDNQPSFDGTFTGTIDNIQLWDGGDGVRHKNTWRRIDL